MTIDLEIKQLFIDDAKHRGHYDESYETFITNPDNIIPAIKQLIEAKVREVEKAYGGCHKCYGKGYSTTWSGLASNRDFDSPGFVTPPKNHMRFCTCDRGKQLEKQLQSNQEGDRDEI